MYYFKILFQVKSFQIVYFISMEPWFNSNWNSMKLLTILKMLFKVSLIDVYVLSDRMFHWKYFLIFYQFVDLLKRNYFFWIHIKLRILGKIFLKIRQIMDFIKNIFWSLFRSWTFLYILDFKIFLEYDQDRTF